MKRILAAAAVFAISATAAHAADLAKRPVYTKAPAPIPFTWTGSYIGGFVGGAFADGDVVTTDPRTAAGLLYTGAPNRSYDLDSSFIGGFTSGYNWQFAPNWVIGYEGETGYIRLRESAIINPPGLGNGLNDTLAITKIGSTYSAWTARFGYAWDRSLLYVKGGAMLTKVETGVSDLTGPIALRTVDDKWRVGYAIGGGWEYAFDNKWSVKAEYLYLGIDHTQTRVGVTNTGVAFVSSTNVPGIHTGKIGLNYKWDFWSLLR